MITFTTNSPEETMRIVHSIKGMAAVMEYQSLADITHELESLISQDIENGVIKPQLIGPLFVYIDKLQEFAQLLEVGYPETKRQGADARGVLFSPMGDRSGTTKDSDGT